MSLPAGRLQHSILLLLSRLFGRAALKLVLTHPLPHFRTDQTS
jgi:hypothetical protein